MYICTYTPLTHFVSVHQERMSAPHAHVHPGNLYSIKFYHANLIIFEEAVQELGRVLQLCLPNLPVVINLHSWLITCHLSIQPHVHVYT